MAVAATTLKEHSRRQCSAIKTGKPGHGPNARVCLALAQLLEAHHYAQTTGESVWTYAVDLGALRDDGLSTNDLRWLVCAGYAAHAQETTEDADDRRMFRQVPNLRFDSDTCFVLTDAGILLAKEAPDAMPGLGERVSVRLSQVSESEPRNVHVGRSSPTWNPIRRELCLDGRVVKRFRLPSPNQETVLAAFEEECWPEMIADPLPQQPNQDPKRRLQDTLKALNRHQINRLVRFKGDGTGEGVLWEPSRKDAAISR